MADGVELHGARPRPDRVHPRRGRRRRARRARLEHRSRRLRREPALPIDASRQPDGRRDLRVRAPHRPPRRGRRRAQRLHRRRRRRHDRRLAPRRARHRHRRPVRPRGRGADLVARECTVFLRAYLDERGRAQLEPAARCVLAPGAGVGLVWTLDVGGQRSAPSSASASVSYAPPTLRDVSVGAGVRRATEGRFEFDAARRKPRRPRHGERHAHEPLGRLEGVLARVGRPVARRLALRRARVLRRRRSRRVRGRSAQRARALRLRSASAAVDGGVDRLHRRGGTRIRSAPRPAGEAVASPPALRGAPSARASSPRGLLPPSPLAHPASRLQGANFASRDIADGELRPVWNGVTLAPSLVETHAHTLVRLRAPAGVGDNHTLALQLGARRSNAVRVAYCAPEIIGFSPSPFDADGGVAPLTLFGASFGAPGAPRPSCASTTRCAATSCDAATASSRAGRRGGARGRRTCRSSSAGARALRRAGLRVRLGWTHRRRAGRGVSGRDAAHLDGPQSSATSSALRRSSSRCSPSCCAASPRRSAPRRATYERDGPSRAMPSRSIRRPRTGRPVRFAVLSPDRPIPL